MRFLSGVMAGVLSLGTFALQSSDAPGLQKPTPSGFVAITSARVARFQYLASHTSRKYLPETMGAGVALFDYDNDGRLDVFFVTGAPLSYPTPKGTIPPKTGSSYWNRPFRQKPDGTFT